jgi:hypothetical protein
MRKTITTVVLVCAAIYILVPSFLSAAHGDPPDPYQPSLVKDTVGVYEYFKLPEGWEGYVFKCPGDGDIKCTLWNDHNDDIPEMFGYFDSDDNYYYFEAIELEDGTITNYQDGDIVMAVPRSFLDDLLGQ